jgi:hypothetical protein
MILDFGKAKRFKVLLWYNKREEEGRIYLEIIMNERRLKIPICYIYPLFLAAFLAGRGWPRCPGT